MEDSSGAEGRRNKLETKQDRISTLPDCLIHHILSFLPSTQEAIQTGILSKRWKNQWTRVPVLIFDCCKNHCFCWEDFTRFIDSALLQHDCSRIKKLQLANNFENDDNLCSKLSFAIRNNVEELILHCYSCDSQNPYHLPKFLSDNASLVKLELIHCYFMDTWSINWGSLRALTMNGYTSEELVANVLSGSPSLEFLELHPYGGGDYVIASNSLKKLVLSKNTINYAIEISCPNLEEFNFCGSTTDTFKLLSIPSLISATLDLRIFPYKGRIRSGGGAAVSKQILDQLQNVKELTIGSFFIKVLSDLEMEGLSYPWNGPNFEYVRGIICALRSSPMLERLVIKLQVYKSGRNADLPDLNDPQENYLNSNRIVSSCLVSHLRTVKIVDLSKEDAKCKLVIDFIEFLLKNAGALEKLVLIISKGEGTDFALAVSQKVSSFPRCSPHAIVQLLRPEYLDM